MGPFVHQWIKRKDYHHNIAAKTKSNLALMEHLSTRDLFFLTPTIHTTARASTPPSPSQILASLPKSPHRRNLLACMIRVEIPSQLFACARPGYDFGRNEPVPGETIQAWLHHAKAQGARSILCLSRACALVL